MEDKKYRFQSIEGCEKIGQGKHGKVFRLNEEQIIKVFYDKSSLATIEKERDYSKRAFVLGVPTAITFGVVETELGYGVIYEAAGSMPLGTYMENHPDQIDEYATKFADILLHLNSIEADKTVYGSVHKWYVEQLRSIPRNYLAPKYVEVLVRIIEAIPEKGNFLHTDYHPQNIMMNDRGELLIIDMADVGYGNGIFDIGGAYMTMKYLPRTNAKNCREITGMSPQNCLKVWDILLRRYYGTDDPEKLRRREKLCQFLSDIRMAVMLSSSIEMKTYEKYIIGFIERWKVIRRAEDYIEALHRV